MTYGDDPADLRDINEQLLIAGLREQQLATELRRQLAFTSAITTSLGEGVCALDPDGYVTFANPAATLLLGWSNADLSGQALHELIHVDCDHNCPLYDAISEGTTRRDDDDMFACRDGTLIPVAYSVAPIESDSMPTGVVIAFHDIVDRKRLLHQAQVARSQAEAALRLRTELMEMVAHDLRTPLTAIKGTAQLLGRRVAASEAIDAGRLDEGLKQIDAAAARMMTILSDLLDEAQLRSDELVALNLRQVDLVDLVAAVVEEHCATSNHEVIVEKEQDSLVGTWDGPRLKRVVANLLSNADKYSPAKYPIRLRVSRDHTVGAGTWAVLSVRDEGVGISSTDLPRVFERFYRGSNVATSSDGIGIGLAGAKAIVEHHGGTIDIASIEGTSTTVTVRLPCV